jgi:hypothetical protein
MTSRDTFRNPRFSIVMPTRNHAELLPRALESALQQTFDDYEIVVSDNCSTDPTPEVVGRYGSARVRYARAPRPLSLGENFEYAFDQATGDYVIFLPDDDAVTPYTLAKAAEILDAAPVDLVVWNYCNYFYDDWRDEWRRGSAQVSTFSGVVRMMDARQVLSQFFSKSLTIAFPYLTNCVYRRKFLMGCKPPAAGLFGNLAGDYYAAVLALSQLKEYLHFDQPLSVYGWRSGGTTALQMKGPQNLTVDSSLCDPLQLPLQPCYVANATLTAQAAAGERAAGFRWNPAPYFIDCHKTLSEMQAQGKQAAKALEHFAAVLRRQPAGVQEEVRAGMENCRVSPIKQLVRGFVDKSFTLYQLERALRPEASQWKARWIRGKDAGFSNILECATKLDALLGGQLQKPSQWENLAGASTAGVPTAGVPTAGARTA